MNLTLNNLTPAPAAPDAALLAAPIPAAEAPPPAAAASAAALPAAAAFAQWLGLGQQLDPAARQVDAAALPAAGDGPAADADAAGADPTVAPDQPSPALPPEGVQLAAMSMPLMLPPAAAAFIPTVSDAPARDQRAPGAAAGASTPRLQPGAALAHPATLPAPVLTAAPAAAALALAHPATLPAPALTAAPAAAALALAHPATLPAPALAAAPAAPALALAQPATLPAPALAAAPAAEASTPRLQPGAALAYPATLPAPALAAAPAAAALAPALALAQSRAAGPIRTVNGAQRAPGAGADGAAAPLPAAELRTGLDAAPMAVAAPRAAAPFQAGAPGAADAGLAAEARPLTDDSAGPASDRPAANWSVGAPATAAARVAPDTVVLAGPPTAWRQALHEALGENLNLQLSRRSEQAVIRLDPPLFGRIEIAIRHRAGALDIKISATHSEVLRQLNAVSDNLRSDLAQRQFSEVAVTVVAAPRGAQAAPHGEPQQGRGRQPARDEQPHDPGRALADGSDAASLFSLNAGA